MKKNTINNNYENTIKNIADILHLGETREAGDSLQMCCPFHKENNPSFGIDMNKGVYHCFACGAKGHISKISNNLRSNIVAEKIDSINNFEITAKIDTIGYSAKPSGGEIGAIRNRLVTISITKYTISDFLKKITAGHTVSLSGAKTNKEWTSQQIVMLDIDNDYTSITMNDVINYAKSINLEPTFAYYTFSSTDDIQRFRLGYVFKNPITDPKEYSAIVTSLIKKFEEYSADKSCADFSRLFFGTNNTDVFISNIIYSTRFTSEQLSSVGKLVYSDSSNTSNISKNIKETENQTISTYDENDFYIGNKFQHHIFGQYMIDNYHIIRLNNNQLHLYNEGIYENNNDTHDIEAKMSDIIPKIKNRDIDEAMGYISRRSKREVESDYRFIAFTNGILNIVTMNFIPFTPDIIVKSRVNTEYMAFNKSLTNPIVDKFFEDITCNDKEQEQLLYEIIGYCCCRTNMFHLAFIIKGNGGNGKSTYFKIIKELLGNSASSIRLRKVTNDKFAITSLYGKTVAIADDINNGKDVDTGLLKTIISGDAIRAEYKFENEFEFEPVATILIGMNNTVTFADTSDGFARRFKVIPFNHKFIEGKNRNNNMKNILCTSENLKYICSKAMFYFNQVLKEDKFSTPQEVESETKSYLLENRIVEQFLIDVPVGKSETAEVYAEFKSWCKENDYTVLNNYYFGRELARLGFKRERGTSGKRPYYYISPNYKEEDDISARIEQANQVDIKDTVFDIGINLDELGL